MTVSYPEPAPETHPRRRGTVPVAVLVKPPRRAATSHENQPVERRQPGIRAIQILLGLTWILAGALQFQPFMFSNGFLHEIIAPVAQGQPGWIAATITWSVHVMSHHLVAYNATFATIQVLIGAGLLFRRSVRVALFVSFGWALGVWWFGEGLGLIPTGTASPLSGAPGAVILYGLVGALVWPRRLRQGPVADRDAAPGWAAPLGRVIWAALWLLSAALWLMPANRASGSTHDVLEGASYGWLTQAQHAAASAANGNGLTIAIGLAGLSVLIALGALVPAATRPALIAGTVLALAYWGFGQSFGLFTTGTATDVSTGPLVVLLALRLWGDPVRVDWPSLLPAHRARVATRARPSEIRTPAPYGHAGAGSSPN